MVDSFTFDLRPQEVQELRDSEVVARDRQRDRHRLGAARRHDRLWRDGVDADPSLPRGDRSSCRRICEIWQVRREAPCCRRLQVANAPSRHGLVDVGLRRDDLSLGRVDLVCSGRGLAALRRDEDDPTDEQDDENHRAQRGALRRVRSDAKLIAHPPRSRVRGGVNVRRDRERVGSTAPGASCARRTAASRQRARAAGRAGRARARTRTWDAGVPVTVNAVGTRRGPRRAAGRRRGSGAGGRRDCAR